MRTLLIDTLRVARGSAAVIMAAGIVVGLTAGGGVATASELAGSVIDGCTVVANPTASNHTICSNMDLHAANFSNQDLQFADLSGSTFAYCLNIDQNEGCQATNFTDADLMDANVSDATFLVFAITTPPPQTHGIEADVTGAILTGANASGVHASPFFWGAVGGLTDVDFSHADLADGLPGGFNGLDLSGDNFTDAVADGADFTGANLTSATFTGTQLGGATFSDANLTSDTFTGAAIGGADFTGTIVVPPDRTVVATSRTGATVSWSTLPSITGLTPGSCSPPSGSSFPIGSTYVNCAVGAATSSGVGDFIVDVANPGPLTIATTSLPGATRGVPYSVQLKAQGGWAPNTWRKLIGGRLPGGLSLNRTTGVISGTPTRTCTTSTFIIEVLDTPAGPRTQDKAKSTFTIDVSPAG